jgi:hypothetical protein
VDWALYNGIGPRNRRTGNEEAREAEQTAHGCTQDGNLEHDDERLLVDGKACDTLMVVRGRRFGVEVGVLIYPRRLFKAGLGV